MTTIRHKRRKEKLIEKPPDRTPWHFTAIGLNTDEGLAYIHRLHGTPGVCDLDRESRYALQIYDNGFSIIFDMVDIDNIAGALEIFLAFLLSKDIDGSETYEIGLTAEERLSLAANVRARLPDAWGDPESRGALQ